MTINFTKTLQESLQNIQYNDYHEFIIHDKEEERTHLNSDELISHYGNVKWAIVDKLNESYSEILENVFDHYNWLNYNEDDEVAYFINEAGSNSLSHSQFKVPHKFHLWQGSKGFVIGIEQKGNGFNALKVNKEKIKDNEGAAFEFFRKCNSSVFFDDAEDARVVYMEFMF